MVAEALGTDKTPLEKENEGHSDGRRSPGRGQQRFGGDVLSRS